MTEYEPVTYGPVWKKNADGSWLLPENTIGDSVIGWIEDYLLDQNTGVAPVLTDSQKRRLLWFYAVDEEGQFLFREWSYVGHRGSGKSWMGMLIAAVEFVGPCRFGGWDSDGWAIARTNPSSWVQVVGTSQDATRNSSMYMAGLFSKHAIATYHVDLGKQITYSNGRRLEFVTTSARALMGGRPSLTVLDEPHMMTLAGDHELYRTIDDNSAKDGTGSSRVVLTSNCWATNEDSVMQRRFESWEKAHEKGLDTQLGLVMDMIAAPANIEVNAETAPGLLRTSFGDHHWMKVDRVLQSVLDPERSMSDIRRFWLSQPVAAEDAMFTLTDWECGLRPDVPALAKGDRIVMGCDPSLTEDSTALVAIRLSDGAIFVLHLQERPYGSVGWEMNREALDGAVRTAFTDYKIAGFRSDVNPLQSYVDAWHRDLGPSLEVKATVSKSSIGWSMTGGGMELVNGVERLGEDIRLSNLIHGDVTALKRHMLNVRRRGTRWGVTITKSSPDSTDKIDIIAALLLANMARTQVLNSAQPRKRVLMFK